MGSPLLPPNACLGAFCWLKKVGPRGKVRALPAPKPWKSRFCEGFRPGEPGNQDHKGEKIVKRFIGR
jgi:hypothetical protein